MNTSIFKALDIRGIYPTEINEDAATVIAKACAHVFPEGEIIIAFDARHGSPELAARVRDSFVEEATIQKKKISIREVGLSSTPMFYFLVNHFKASGGIMITASHNPKNYNGMKVVRAGAEMIPGVEVLEYIKKFKFI
jgi:phosphomannomutase